MSVYSRLRTCHFPHFLPIRNPNYPTPSQTTTKPELKPHTQVQAILDGVISLSNQNIDLVEIQGTVEDVTSDKARRAAEAVRIMPCPNIAYKLICKTPGQRPSPSRRHMSLFQSHERFTRAVHVRLIPHRPFLRPSSALSRHSASITPRPFLVPIDR
jgi:hypothetical protein